MLSALLRLWRSFRHAPPTTRPSLSPPSVGPIFPGIVQAHYESPGAKWKVTGILRLLEPRESGASSNYTHSTNGDSLTTSREA